MNETINETVDSVVIGNELCSFTMSYTTLVVTFITVFLYVVYYCKLREPEFVIKPRYDVKKKKIGKPLPPYPNGWYVALHTKNLNEG
jgi:hypothetical protein